MHQFDEKRVRALVLEWQCDQRPELLNQILLLAQPLLSGVILSRSTYVEDFDETLVELRIKLWKKLPHYDCSKGRVYTYLTMVAHQMVDELWAKRKLYQERYMPTSGG